MSTSDRPWLEVLEIKFRHDVPLTTTEAATIIGCDAETLKKKRVTGNGPKFIRVERNIYYRPTSIISWLSNRPEFNSTAEADCRE